LPYLAGEIALSLGDQKVVEKMMPCFLKLWAAQIPSTEKDNIQLSNSFLFAMGENPQAFFSAMAKETDAFSQWLSEFPKLSFSPINSSSCALEDKRKRVIDVLQKAQITGTKEQEFNKAVLLKLSGMPTTKGCR
jgi:hypothetical protein